MSSGAVEEQLAVHGRALADGLTAHLGGWVRRVVEQRLADWGGEVAGDVAAAIERAGMQAVALAAPRLVALANADVDALSDTPLSIVRDAVVFPTAVLKGAGVPPILRDDFDRDRFPHDLYGLTPANLNEVDPGVGELALVWGAARAFVLADRRRSERRR